MVHKLDSVVKEDGLLIIRSSNYIFSDTKTSNNYQLIKNNNARKSKAFPKFNSQGLKKNRLL